MATVFTMIIEGDLPGTFVWRDDTCVAFMSINPITHGHTLVVPIEEVDQWTDLSEDTAAHLMRVAHRIGVAQKAAFSPTRIGQMIAGFEVPHTHVHVLPIDNMGDMSFANAAASVDPSELSTAADAIKANLDS